MDNVQRRATNPPDFLVKLLTMVQEEDPDLINWNGGKLFIHDPLALERKMSAYFRHSNFSSFQRQLNNFGFRKVEGKGKLAPCMYMHDDLIGLPPDSLLRIRRKPTVASGAPSSSTTQHPYPSYQHQPKRQRFLDHSGETRASSPPPPPPAGSFGTRGGDSGSSRVTRQRAYLPEDIPPHRPTRHLEAFTGIDNARPYPIGGGPVLGRDQFIENAAHISDSFESGLLLSFLEASDSGAIAPSLLSQLTGSDKHYPMPASVKRERDAEAALYDRERYDASPPPNVFGVGQRSAQDLHTDDDGTRGHFNIFGKKHYTDEDRPNPSSPVPVQALARAEST